MRKKKIISSSNIPYFPKGDIKMILKTIKSVLENRQVMQGKYVEEFERRFAKFVGAKYAIAVNSGTSALQGALNYFDIRGREVLVPVNTFLASANAVLFEGGIPIFVDINPTMLCIDVTKIEERINKKTKGIILVHLAGLITPDIERIKKICKKHKIFLLEDASHAQGSEIHGKRAGAFGDAAAFSLLASKVITSGGEGGIVTSNNKKLIDRIRSLRFHGEDHKRGIQDRLGYSWRMTEMQAVVGIEQVKRLPEIVRKRMAIGRAYDHAFRNLSKVSPVPVEKDSKNTYYKYPLIMDRSLDRLKVKKRLIEEFGIKSGTSYWPPCHLQPAYKKKFKYKKRDFPIAEDVLDRTISLPIYTSMTKTEVSRVIEGVKKVCG